MILETRTSPS
ncbi:hypothetical protein CP061683_0914A, partial [Chlamydia psittaci 06-1683]